jgi:hypothetical protein
MTELRDDFRATAQDIAQDARQLEAIEDEKLAIDPDDPRARSLSTRAEELAEELYRKSLAERDLTETASEAG